MNYKKMWNELKEQVAHDLQFHQSGEGQSTGESVYGQVKCIEVLNYMSKLEVAKIVEETYKE